MKNQPKPFYTEAYSDTGKGPTVILLQGLFGNLSMWRHLITKLERDFRIVIPRLPIFELPERYTNIEYMAMVLHEFIIWHNLKDVTLIGHDLGGQIALKYGHLFPGHLKSMILTGSIGLSHDLLHNDTEDDYAHIQRRVKDILYDGTKVTRTLVEEVFDVLSNSSKRSAVRSLINPSNENNVSSFLYLINLPVLLIWGLQDTVTPPEVAIHLHDLLPHAELNLIDRCGHLPMLEHSENFNHSLVGFLNKVY